MVRKRTTRNAMAANEANEEKCWIGRPCGVRKMRCKKCRLCKRQRIMRHCIALACWCARSLWSSRASNANLCAAHPICSPIYFFQSCSSTSKISAPAPRLIRRRCVNWLADWVRLRVANFPRAVSTHTHNPASCSSVHSTDAPHHRI